MMAFEVIIVARAQKTGQTVVNGGGGSVGVVATMTYQQGDDRGHMLC